MIAKITSKNQITIPKKIMDLLPEVRHFDIEMKDGIVILKPLRFYDTDVGRIRSKIAKLGVKQNAVAEAIKWAREK
jgi:bifunctional DNA-binding transcriptional regulator/antitoxin component of YhaV-PrlF toxin-antitoxin module